LTINKRERERDREREKRERHMREREKEEREKRRERGYLLGTILHSDARRMTEGKERERERERRLLTIKEQDLKPLINRRYILDVCWVAGSCKPGIEEN
jgi:hypothetical protein